jgi:DNA-binding NarL/FixJ family response regulator
MWQATRPDPVAVTAAERPGPTAPPRVLLVDADPVARAALARALTEGGCKVVASLRTGIGATYACRTQHPTVAVIELDLRPAGTWSGLLLIPILVKEGARVLVVTRPELAHLAGRAVAAGARRMLSKTDIGELVAAVNDEHTSHVRAGHPP